MVLLVVASLVITGPAAEGHLPGEATRAERVKIDRQVTGGRAVRGRLAFEVPADWTAQHSLGHSRKFTTATADDCGISIVVEPTAMATRKTTAAQVANRLVPGHRVTRLGRGSRAHGSWGIDEVAVGARGNRRDVYGVGVVHVTAHVYVHVRVLAVLARTDSREPCRDDDVRKGPLHTAVERIVRHAAAQAKVTDG